MLLKFILNFFLQCCVGFLHTTVQISHNYTSISSVLGLPALPRSIPAVIRAPHWAPCPAQQLLISYILPLTVHAC